MDSSIDSIALEMERYSKTLDPESTRYWEFHHERFKFTTRLTGELINKLERSNSRVERILDVGNSYQTMMVNRIRPDVQIDTLGFLGERYKPGGITRHHQFDLNDAYYPERWIALEEREKYDIILFLEVIEHLYTAPEQVLDFLGSFLKPNGIILIQTPNAASFLNRVKLLLGRNPYELIRTDRSNPGHFREYTKQEITNIALQSGFIVEDLLMMDYFKLSTPAGRICQKIATILPATFRTGMTIVLKKK